MAVPTITLSEHIVENQLPVPLHEFSTYTPIKQGEILWEAKAMGDTVFDAAIHSREEYRVHNTPADTGPSFTSQGHSDHPRITGTPEEYLFQAVAATAPEEKPYKEVAQDALSHALNHLDYYLAQLQPRIREQLDDPADDHQFLHTAAPTGDRAPLFLVRDAAHRLRRVNQFLNGEEVDVPTRGQDSREAAFFASAREDRQYTEVEALRDAYVAEEALYDVGREFMYTRYMGVAAEIAQHIALYTEDLFDEGVDAVRDRCGNDFVPVYRDGVHMKQVDAFLTDRETPPIHP